MKARILHRDVSAGNLFSYGHESPASGGQAERHNVSNDWGLSILLDARRQQQFERTVRCLFNLLISDLTLIQGDVAIHVCTSIE